MIFKVFLTERPVARRRTSEKLISDRRAFNPFVQFYGLASMAYCPSPVYSHR